MYLCDIIRWWRCHSVMSSTSLCWSESCRQRWSQSGGTSARTMLNWELSARGSVPTTSSGKTRSRKLPQGPVGWSRSFGCKVKEQQVLWSVFGFLSNNYKTGQLESRALCCFKYEPLFQKVPVVFQSLDEPSKCPQAVCNVCSSLLSETWSWRVT